MNDPRDRQAKRQPDIKVVHVNCSTSRLQKYIMLCQHKYWFCRAPPQPKQGTYEDRKLKVCHEGFTNQTKSAGQPQ